MNERLKLLRKTLKLSQDAFAERIGMKGSSISLLESGGRNITEQVIKSIDKLNTVKEALELIEILEYDECIAVLTGTKNLTSEIHSALMRRGKEANGGKTTLA